MALFAKQGLSRNIELINIRISAMNEFYLGRNDCVLQEI